MSLSGYIRILRKYTFVIVSVVFTVSTIISILLFYLNYKLRIVEQNQEFLFAQELLEDQMDQTLKSSYNALYILALTVDENGIPYEFDSVASNLIATNKEFRTLELLPNGVVEYVYPLKGNEGIIGFDILNNKHNTREARIAIKKRNVHFAGPIHLKQGGTAVVGRMPIFRKGKFWGFSVAIIGIEEFLKATGIKRFNNENFEISISKKLDHDNSEEFFFGDIVEANREPDIYIEEGNWNIYISRIPSRRDVYSFLLIVFTGFVFSVGSGWLIYRFLNKSRLELNKINNEINVHLVNSPLGIIEFNSKLNIIRWNKRCEEIFGWSEKEVLSRQFDAGDLMFADDYNAFKNLATELLEGESNGITAYTKNNSKNDKALHCVWYNSVITDEVRNTRSILCLVQDISIEKSYEIELARNEAELRLVVNAASELMVLLAPSANGDVQIKSCNRAFKEFFGKGHGELKGLYLADIIGLEKVKEFKKWWLIEAKNKTREYFESDIEIEGETYYFENKLSTLEQNEYLENTVLLVSRDITKKKQRSLKLDKTLELTKNQNDRLLNFAYIVSHNLRSHTSNIGGILNLVKQTDEEAQKLEYLNYLEKVSSSLDETMLHLNQVVDIQTGKELETQNINLYQRINYVVGLQQSEIENTNSVVFNQVNKELVVPFNNSYLDSVLLNFLTNSIKYRDPSRPPVITFSAEKNDEFIILSIRDNGLGIDLKKHGSNLFGLYKRFHKGAPGKGIGLFITKNQIEAMGGRLELTSESGVGSTFRVFFNKCAPSV